MKLIDEFQHLFMQRIEEKNSWGKNEIATLFKDCLLRVLVDKSKDA